MSRQPKSWVESTLVAYVDGQLDKAQTAAVEATLRDDPEARAIVGVLRRSADAVKSAFDQPLGEPVPARLLAAIGGGEVQAAGSRIVRLPIVHPHINRNMMMVLAASVAALVIGFGAGYLKFAPGEAIHLAGAPSVGPETGQFEAALYQALESGDEGVAVPYDDTASGRRGTVTVVGPVATGLGADCREFRDTWIGTDKTSHGLACRSDAGEWSILSLPPQPTS